jgi:hypothetical protein
MRTETVKVNEELGHSLFNEKISAKFSSGVLHAHGVTAVRGSGGCTVQEPWRAAAPEDPTLPPPVQHPQALPMGHVRRVDPAALGRL